MPRVMIVGQPGSGKSTLARALSVRTGLPVVHIDRIHWQSGWVERSQEEKSRLCREVEARDSWIFEGCHSPTWDTRIARPDLPEGCPERLGNPPEFLAFIWRMRRTARDGLARLAAEAPCPVVRLRSDGEVAGFLARLSARRRSLPGERRPC